MIRFVCIIINRKEKAKLLTVQAHTIEDAISLLRKMKGVKKIIQITEIN